MGSASSRAAGETGGARDYLRVTGVNPASEFLDDMRI